MTIKCPSCGTELANFRGIGGHVRHCNVTTEQLFWLKVDKDGAGGCWLWLGYCQPDGYGQVGIDGSTLNSHRYLYEKVKGLVPDGLEIMHSCDVRNCVNPDHMSVGTDAQNVADKIAKGRIAWGEKCPRRKLSEVQAREILALKGCGPASKYAGKYGVNQGAIHAIWRGASWAYLDK